MQTTTAVYSGSLSERIKDAAAISAIGAAISEVYDQLSAPTAANVSRVSGVRLERVLRVLQRETDRVGLMTLGPDDLIPANLFA